MGKESVAEHLVFEVIEKMLVAEPGDEKLALGSALTGTALCWEASPPLQRKIYICRVPTRFTRTHRSN